MNKIKLSDIRAKFPMYSEVDDATLLGALHKKFYPEIPRGDFLQSIDFDTNRKDPTEGMSGGQKFLAGVGKAFTDVGRGVGQMFGAVSNDDVAESRKRDEALMKTGAGFAGNLTGNVSAMLPAAFLPGAATIPGAAAIGATTGFIAPSTGAGDAVKNTALGAAAGPLGIGVGRLLGAGYQGGKALLEPFTSRGQESIAARTLQQFATNPARAAQNLRGAQELVPGSAPTMAQAAQDPGLAQLERTLANSAESQGALHAQYGAQRAARIKALDDVAGTDEFYNGIKQGRDIFAKEDYSKAMDQGIDAAMAKALQPQIKSLMGRPSIQEAKKVALQLARENDEAITDFGSIRGMDYLKKALDNAIDRAAQPGSAVGKERLRALVQTKNDLGSVLEQIAPAYAEAGQNFAGMSRQINSMDVARALRDKFEPALARFGADTREQGSAYARALESAMDSVKKSTGMNKGLSEVMNPGDVATLQNIAKDFARKAKADDLGRSVGSNTAQNLSSQNLMRQLLGPTGLPNSWAESQVLQSLLTPYSALTKVSGAQGRMMDRLTKAAIDPKDAAGLLMLAQTPSKASKLGLLAAPLSPTLPLGGLLTYGAEQ